MSREYAAEMRAVIEAETSHGPFVSRVVAREIVEKLTVNDPDLLSGWLNSQAEQLIWGAINTYDRSKRASARTSRSAFAKAAEDFEEGDDEALGHWLSTRYVVEDGSRRVLATLTKNDLLFVAQTYDDRAQANAFEAQFMRALAKKVRNGTVADHFDEATIAKMRASLS